MDIVRPSELCFTTLTDTLGHGSCSKDEQLECFPVVEGLMFE